MQLVLVELFELMITLPVPASLYLPLFPSFRNPGILFGRPCISVVPSKSMQGTELT